VGSNPLWYSVTDEDERFRDDSKIDVEYSCSLKHKIMVSSDVVAASFLDVNAANALVPLTNGQSLCINLCTGLIDHIYQFQLNYNVTSENIEFHSQALLAAAIHSLHLTISETEKQQQKENKFVSFSSELDAIYPSSQLLDCAGDVLITSSPFRIEKMVMRKVTSNIKYSHCGEDSMFDVLKGRCEDDNCIIYSLTSYLELIGLRPNSDQTFLKRYIS